jgi:hypothetical protein
MADNETRNTWIVFAATFFVLTIILTGFGLSSLYGDARVVGGDAYNYIIGANRGIGLICAGIASALLGIACTVMTIFTIHSSYRQVQLIPPQVATPEVEPSTMPEEIAEPSTMKTHMGSPIVDKQTDQ